MKQSCIPRFLSSASHVQPELRPLGPGDPQPQEFLLALEVDGEREVDGAGDDRTLLPRFDEQAIEVDDRVDGLKGPGLPGLEIVDHRLGHGRDQGGRDLGAVEFLQVALDLAGGHPARVERNHLVVEALETALALLHELRREGTRPVARDLDRESAGVGQHGLGAGAVAGVLAGHLRLLVRVVA
jgi:hypothetical protein